MEQLPIVRPGERVVARSDGKGGLILGVEKIKGREFAASAECSGYVLDARLLMDVLGSLKMPGPWFQVWCKLVALQNANRADDQVRIAARGFVKTNQRDLQARCNLSAASVNGASQLISYNRSRSTGTVPPPLHEGPGLLPNAADRWHGEPSSAGFWNDVREGFGIVA